VVGTVCVGAFMGQVDSSIAQMLLPRLELKFDARLQHRELGRGCPSLGNGGVPADLRSARRQAPVHGRVPAVHAELGALRPGSATHVLGVDLNRSESS